MAAAFALSELLPSGATNTTVCLVFRRCSCLYPTCTIDMIQVNAGLTVIRWKGDKKIIDWVVWFAMQWIKESSVYNTSCWKAVLGSCFPWTPLGKLADQLSIDQVSGVKDTFELFSKLFKKKDEKKKEKTLGARLNVEALEQYIENLEKKYFCSQFVVVVWQAAMIYVVQGDPALILRALPVRADKCTPNNLSELPEYYPGWWKRISLSRLQTMFPTNKKSQTPPQIREMIFPRDGSVRTPEFAAAKAEELRNFLHRYFKKDQIADLTTSVGLATLAHELSMSPFFLKT